MNKLLVEPMRGLFFRAPVGRTAYTDAAGYLPQVLSEKG